MMSTCISCKHVTQARLTRGCCRPCYERLLRLVHEGPWTWEAFAQVGLVRPPRYRTAEQRAQGRLRQGYDAD